MTALLHPDNSYDIAAIKTRARQYARRELRAAVDRATRKILREALTDAWGDARQSWQLHTGNDCVMVSDAAFASMATDGPMRGARS